MSKEIYDDGLKYVSPAFQHLLKGGQPNDDVGRWFPELSTLGRNPLSGPSCPGGIYNGGRTIEYWRP